MDHGAEGHVASMQGTVHHPSMHEIIQEPPRVSIKWDKAKVFERLHANPEAAAVIPEQILGYGYIVCGLFP